MNKLQRPQPTAKSTHLQPDVIKEKKTTRVELQGTLSAFSTPTQPSGKHPFSPAGNSHSVYGDLNRLTSNSSKVLDISAFFYKTALLIGLPVSS